MDFPAILFIYIFDAFNTPVFIRDHTKSFILENCIFFAKGLFQLKKKSKLWFHKVE